jgi:hypothetical protein
MFDRIIRLFENAKTELLVFVNAYTMVITTDDELIKPARLAARARGVKLRYITEITKENLSYCKRMKDMVCELRHLDHIAGNFVLSDSEFVSSPEISQENPITDGYYSNVGKVIGLERNVFETFWKYAIPAETRIGQLEAGLETTPRPPPTTLGRDKKTVVIDRFYICEKCGEMSIFRDDAQEHQRTTGHGKTKEFPIFF